MSRYLSFKLGGSIKLRIYASLLLLSILFLVVSVFIHQHYNAFFLQEAKRENEDALLRISTTITSLFDEIYNTNALLSGNESIRNIMMHDDSSALTNVWQLSQAVDALSLLVMTKDVIDQAYILPRYGDIVISNRGTQHVELFFERTNRYELYPLEFWQNATAPRGRPFLLLNTTRVYDYGGMRNARTVIPILTHRLGGILSHSLLVVDINEEALSRILIQHRFTESSHFYLSDGYGNILVSTNRNNPVFPIADMTVLDTARGANTYVFIEGSGRSAMLNIVHPIILMNRSLYYISRTPMSDIYDRYGSVRLYTMVVISITFVVSLLIIIFMVKKLYNPIGNAVITIQNKMDKPLESDIFYLKDGISQIFKEHEDLKSEFTKALPLILEQYLQKILSNNELFDKSELENLIDNANIRFKYPCFAAAIVINEYTDKFFTDFTLAEQQKIYNTLIEVLKSPWDFTFQVFVLVLDQSRLCVLVNLPPSASTDIMVRLINDFHDLLVFDEQYLALYAGVGQIHEGFDGIYRSYYEANNVASKLSRYSDEKIVVYNPENAVPVSSFSFDEESKLFNYLIGGYHDHATQILKIIINRNVANNISEAYLKELLVRFYMIGERAIKHHDMSIESLMMDYPSHFLQNYSDLPYHDLVSYITTLYARITEDTPKPYRKINCDAIRDYIETNYHEDIYLEKLADEYHVSLSYLSRIFKEHYGITFQQYLANTRIGHAKNLLITTNMTINDISEAAGFNSRNTFIRMFKKLEGVTPTEFRTLTNTKQNVNVIIGGLVNDAKYNGTTHKGD